MIQNPYYRQGYLGQSMVSRIALVGFFGAVAVFFGLLASTANPTFIGLSVGLIGGLALLAAPRFCVDLLLVLGLTSGFVLSMAGPGSGKFGWGIALLGMLLLMLSMFKLLTERKETPGFIWLAFAFMLYSCVSTMVQLHSMAEFIAGFKRYFQMYGLMFALVMVAFKPEDYRRWLKIMLVIALIQLPFALFERFVMAATRGGGAEATDVVAGTLGANMGGGSANAEMAVFLIMALAFLMARWREGLIGKPLALSLGLLCLLPLGLGETKIVVIMLPLVWVILMRKDIRKMPGRFILQLIGIVLITAVLGAIYVGLNNRTLEEVLGETARYNVGTGGYGLYLLNRTSVFAFWWAKHGGNDIASTLFGHGLGSSYSSAGNLVPGHLYSQYAGYGIDLTTATSVLWDTGLVGFGLFVAVLLAAWLLAAKLCRVATDPVVRADALALQATVAIFVLFIFYDNALINYLPFEVIVAASLGYLGFLARNSNPEASRAQERGGD